MNLVRNILETQINNDIDICHKLSLPMLSHGLLVERIMELGSLAIAYVLDCQQESVLQKLCYIDTPIAKVDMVLTCLVWVYVYQ